MEGDAHGCFICVICLVMLTTHGEIVPEYLAANQQENFMAYQRNSSNIWQNSITPDDFLIKVFSKPFNSIRRKRDWLIPHVSIVENDKGPFPKQVVKMKSTAADSMTMIYEITGTGANEPPINLFKVGKSSGILWVTKAVDREETEEYTLTVHATSNNRDYTEKPVQLVIKVLDQNDNKPRCTQNPYTGEVLERAKPNTPVMQVTAEDLDDPTSSNSIVRYKLLKQEPNSGVFHIDQTTGVISLALMGILDRETDAVYNLAVEAADMDGHGLSSTCMVAIKITDSNDHRPLFSQEYYAETVKENKAGEVVARLTVTDKDEPLTVNALSKFTIIQGNDRGFFNISTDHNGMDGIITTLKALDFEQANSFSLLIMVENEAPFALPFRTSTATVTITVLDVNEPPVFDLPEKQIIIYEDQSVGSMISKYTATDPDTDRAQKIRYKLRGDIANWLEITEDTGHITISSSLDREAKFIRDGQYKVLVLAFDDDDEPATGTGTFMIKLLDVNDNPPVLEQHKVQMCSTEPKPVRLTITDADEPENGPPFTTELHEEFKSNWTISSDSNSSVLLSSLRPLAVGEHSLWLRLSDSKLLFQDSSLIVNVCDCKGDDGTCSSPRYAASISTPLIFVFVAVFCLLVLIVLLLFLKRRCGRKFQQFTKNEEDRDNIICYNEEGGGEQDQDFDIMLLCGGPEVFYRDIAPTVLPTVVYRQLPEEDEDMENFIYENLCTADDEHYVAPFDSVLVFAHEGEGSKAGSLSSIQSSISDGGLEFQDLHSWGPPFRRLADLYAERQDE
ncbi:uncharacterized protein LOC793186 precursor [Danio rerio]|uniref:Cadherin-1 n=1 Tax=Danio rerio TaxID=7955 RepID=A0AB13A7X0_DANRE|nr:uncharacterized protein LOC793186 precursor [Danio rerio]